MIIRRITLLIFMLILASKALADETLDNFLDHLETTITQEDSEAFHQLINYNVFLNRALNPLTEIAEKSKSAFRRGLMSSSSQISQRLLDSLKANRINRLKVIDNKKESKAIYRFDLVLDGYVFLEFILQKFPQGKYQVVDWYSYTTSDYATTAIRQLLVFALPNDGSLNKFLRVVNGKDKELKDFLLELRRFNKTQNPIQFMRAYEESPEFIKNNPTIGKIYLIAAGKVEDMSIYENALKIFAKYHGNNPRFSFAMVDHYFTLGQYNKAVHALNRFERSLGIADPAIYFLRATSYLEAKDYPKSIQQSRQAISLDPSFEDAYWSLVNAQIYSNKFANAIDTLKNLESHFNYAFIKQDFIDEESFHPLLDTAEFNQWLANKN